ncbi:hypothetical protein [Nocardia cyriacigeorgica]|uniref:hypothetical protein n=1 Tax=Nocardia cyriacigeorgica TaxID=135487 RepID=UPI0024573C91|nr:hypothetical protein [Nocardia cyriacigeorgica]
MPENTTDPHTVALELRDALAALHASAGTSEAIAAAEAALLAHLREHRATLGRLDSWRGTYDEIDTEIDAPQGGTK